MIPLTPELQKMRAKVAKRQAQSKDKGMNVCGLCQYAYRDDLGNTMCGRIRLGEGTVLRKPFEDSCRDWSPRREFQPEVFSNPEANEMFAKRRKWMALAAKGVVVNPIAQAGLNTFSSL